MSGIQNILLGTGSGAAAAVDPFFYSVTSLLHGDGTNGAQNNTFLDSSTNNFTITRNGNTTQGSFSPFSQTGWGNYFSFATPDALRPSATTISNFGTGAFTIEFWVNFQNTNAAGFYYGGASGSAYIDYFSGSLRLGISGGSVPISYAFTPAVGTWYHVAFVRSSTTDTLYVNGTSVATGSDSQNYPSDSGPYVGSWSGASYTGAAYMSNFRVVKGTAVYTANFTPTTTPLTAISGTSLLTCQSNRFIDNSTNAFAITVTGSPSVQPFSPFNPTTAYSTSAVGGSGYFDGSGDYLTFANSSLLNIGSGDFTAEAWVYPITRNNNTIFYKGPVTGPNYDYFLGWDGTTLTVIYGGNTSGTVTDTTQLNAWNHVALVRNTSNNTLRVYINGVQAYSATYTGTYASSSGGGIGGTPGLSGSYAFNGYISGVRIAQSAVYTAAFTPPTAPPTAITNTQLLTNFTNAGIFDNAAVADYETVGNAQISTSVKKYGTGSMSFDGTGDWLITDAPSTQLQAFGTGDFTIEMWVYVNSVAPTFQHIYDGRPASTDGAYPCIRLSSATLQYIVSGSVQITGPSLSVNTWYHLAVSRVASQTKMFVNGTQVGSTYADTTSYLNPASRPVIGGWGYNLSGGYEFNGYIDDLRISKGIGRYPYNFTPPTAEFPNIGGTVTLTADPYFDYTTLLLPGNGTNGAQNNTFLDSSTNAFSITRNGNTTQGTFSPFSQTGWGNYFNGPNTGSYLRTPVSTDFQLGTSDFTIEFWAFTTSGASDTTVCQTDSGGSGYYGMLLNYHDATNVTWYATSNGSSWNVINGGVLCTVASIKNTWAHFAYVRSGNTFTAYVNGTSVYTTTSSASIYQSANQFVFGSSYAGSHPSNFGGYLSNFRYVKGTAVYTSNFTPSTTPLTAITNTKLLSCQSNRFIDASASAHTLTIGGSPTVQAFSPFNPTAAWSAATYGGSGYFDGSGDYLNGPSTGQFAPTGDFTISMWIYPTSFAASFYVLAGSWAGAGAANEWLIQYDNTGAIRFLTTTDSTFSAAGVIKLNQWQFLSISRTGSTLTGYVNGTSFRSYTLTGTVGSATKVVYIGIQSGTTWPYAGYMADFRMVAGSAESATPPTSPATAISGTNMLLNFTNAGILDATSKNDLETVGNAQISTTQSKFGGSSIAFDGTGDYLYGKNTRLVDIGSGDFTIEGWLYPTTSGTTRAIVSQFNTNGTGPGWTSYLKTTNVIEFYGGSGTITVTGTTAVSANAWSHFAICRYGSTITIYVNGVAGGTGTNSSFSDDTTGPVEVGARGGAGSIPFTGYIDDLRITKGIARYTSNFTPPTTAFLTL
jgi:hypothetical protein